MLKVSLVTHTILNNYTNSTGWANMKRMIDLYSGLGGASESFIQDHNWEVLRIDNNELLKDVPNTVMCDLTQEDLFIGKKWKGCDLVWASPPCLDFSLAYNARLPTAIRNGEEFVPDIKPLRSAIRIIKTIKPKYWVIENVSGASKIFSKELGVNAPSQIIGAYFLWGNFPYITMPREWERKQKMENWDIGDPLRSNKRAIIDFEVSKQLKRVLEEQKQLTEWMT